MLRVPGSPFTPDDSVRDVRRVEELTRQVPDSFTVKGMFFGPLVERLGRERFEALRPELADPPRGRYLPFRDYPQGDHGRLLVALMDVLYPDLLQAEGLRRFAREDMGMLARSTFGKVVLAMVRDPIGALLHVPMVYAHVAPRITVTAKRVGDGAELEFRPLYGLYGYMLGQLEGIVGHFGGRPRTEVYDDPAELRVRFVVRVE